jgi:hypothetical protein
LGHVRAYAMHERRVLLDALIAGNPAALKEIRDRSGNDMARVNAIKTAEALRELADDPQRGAGVQRSQPGLVVIIQSNDGRTQQVLGAPVAPLQIEAETDAVDLEP